MIPIPRALAALVALPSLSSCAANPPGQTPEAARGIEWVVQCRAGEDGFASNCVATADAPPFVLRLSTADSQLSVSILHPECEEVRPFDRVDLIGLSRRRRAELVAGAFAEAAAGLHERCPHLPRPALRLDEAPDISMIGEPV